MVATVEVSFDLFIQNMCLHQLTATFLKHVLILSCLFHYSIPLTGAGLTGRSGEDVYIKVPLGTIISERFPDEEDDEEDLVWTIPYMLFVIMCMIVMECVVISSCSVQLDR